VVTEQESIPVPVSHEEVVVERRPASGRASASDLRPGQEIRIPVHGEKVHVEKENVVKEEVSVGKRRVQDTENVSGTVRKEKVCVEEEGDVHARRGNGARTESGSRGGRQELAELRPRTHRLEGGGGQRQGPR
jgi:uncharacterized protein (TIGR02271 family)